MTADALALARRVLELAEAATPGPWKMHHRSIQGIAPAAGIDEYSGCGWDWDEDSAPPEPMRGAFALGADAAFIGEMRTAGPTLARAVVELTAEIERLRADLAAAAPLMRVGMAWLRYSEFADDGPFAVAKREALWGNPLGDRWEILQPGHDAIAAAERLLGGGEG